MILRDQKGVVIIEASIALSAFMFLIVTILSIVNICYAQAKIGTALNESAKEISEYSYLYALTGLNEKQKQIFGDTQGTRTQIDQSIQGIGDLYDSFHAGGEDASHININNLSESIDNIDKDIQEGKEAASQLNTVFDSIADDPKAFVVGLAKLCGSGAYDAAKSRLIAAPVAKCMTKRHLKTSHNGDCEEFLESLGVVEGADGKYIDGIDFTGSTLFPDGNSIIRLEARYKIKVVPLLPIKMEYEICQSAETEGWFGK